MSVLCIAGQTYTLEFSLEDQGNAGLWKADPAIAVADFQISVNGGAFTNVDNIPTVTPAAGRRVALVISAAETTAAAAGGLLYIRGVDAVGDEWYDIGITVRVGGSNEIADAILERGMSNVENAADDTSLAALVLAAFESSITGTTWTIRKTGGTTFDTRTVTVDANASPVTGVT